MAEASIDVPETGSPEARLAAWAERTIGGRVVRIEPFMRWRPAWDIDLDLGGRILPLHARGEREQRIGMPYWIADERRVHDLLEAQGVPVPHVYGYCDDPYCMVMDRLPGNVDLSFAASDEEREQINAEYLALLPRIYAIDLEDARRAGFDIPETPEELSLGLFARFEAAYEARMEEPDPVSEFLRMWVHRHYPRNRSTRRFLTYDAFQYMFDKGRITGLIDFELAHVGDPLTELATLRVRDTIKNLGDLPAIGQAWAEATGEELDHDAIEFHTIAYNANAVVSGAPLLTRPPVEGELMSFQGWYVNGARWAFEDIAERIGVELTTVETPPSRPSRYAPAYEHLVERLADKRPERTAADHEKALCFRVARHLRRLDQIGRALEDADLDDAAELLGRRPDRQGLDTALVAFIADSGPDDEPGLLEVLNRRVQRQHLTLGPEGSQILRHPRMRSLRPGHDAPSGAADDLRWTPGLIAGTR